VASAGQQASVDCAVIVVTYNSERDIAGLLDSLPAAASGLTLRVIVVDNDSADRTVELVRGRPGVLCVQTGANLGFAGGINVGRQHVGQCAAVAVLNPDLVVEPGALRELFTALEDPAVGMVVPMLLEPDGRVYPSLRREPSLSRALGDALLGARLGHRPGWLTETIHAPDEYGYRHVVDWAGGAAQMISAACDRVVGPWDEQFFLYSEEVDYATRVRAAGLRFEYVPAARARHRGSGSGQSPVLCALASVSRIRYAEKHGKHARAYRAVVILDTLLRSADRGHRLALRTVCRRDSWEPLVSSLKARQAQDSAATRSVRV
jgi:GT2 family glycosyltransferase